MEIKPAGRFSVRSDVSVFKRLGKGNQTHIAKSHHVNISVCKYWLAGRCNRNPCMFLHPDTAKRQPIQSQFQSTHLAIADIESKNSWKNPNTHGLRKSPPTADADPGTRKKFLRVLKNELNGSGNQNTQKAQQKVLKSAIDGDQTLKNANAHDSKKSSLRADTAQETQGLQIILKRERNGSENQSSDKTQQKALKSAVDVTGDQSIEKILRKVCNYWITGNCVKGDKCENLHSWSTEDCVSLVTRLGGQTKAVTGIALPSGSDKLYCGSRDKSLRIWDCNSGQCASIVDVGFECGNLISDGPWIFVGLPDTVKAGNLEKQSELSLQGGGGQVNAIAMYNDTVFAGMEDGSVLAWKSVSETSSTGVAESLKGHSRAVLSLVVGANKLFSGSADHTIRVWDPESLKCVHILKGHTGDVTSVLCWDRYLFSGSLDRRIKVWAATETGNIVEVYEHKEDDGVLAFRGIHDSENKPLLLCSCKDNAVRLYDLPSFNERGRIFSREEIQTIETGPGGLFFTGDATGLVSVWRLH